MDTHHSKVFSVFKMMQKLVIPNEKFTAKELEIFGRLLFLSVEVLLFQHSVKTWKISHLLTSLVYLKM